MWRELRRRQGMSAAVSSGSSLPAVKSWQAGVCGEERQQLYVHRRPAEVIIKVIRFLDTGATTERTVTTLQLFLELHPK
ncbi:hypothetical protein E2C01_068889 [Portunus trituberculatus]|uniref:Uncharacterized protein n=1 Tax=Portunus trituberculatus TaxID=210409 RepID=A0A5B7HXX8_PORTR|nr:hypothetical protein [Portunus trituberculatus]